MGSIICLKRPSAYSMQLQPFGGPTTEKKHKLEYGSYLNIGLGQFHSQNAVKTIDSMIKLADQAHPSMKLQNEIFQAKENQDICTLISHMQSDQGIAYPLSMGHPWATSPTTIGSIAIMYISILIMRELTEEDPGYQLQENNLKQKVEIIKQKNVLKILQDNLFHKDKDRVHISVLILVFLVEFQELLEQFYSLNIFYNILPLIYVSDDNPIGFRISVSFICRELYKNQQKLIQFFLKDTKILDSIIDMLKNENTLFIIEGLNNLDEICKLDNYNKLINQNSSQILYEYGFITHLQNIQQKLTNQLEKAENNEDYENINDINFTIQIIKSLINRILQNYQKIT